MTATPAAAPAGFTPCADVRKRIIDNAKLTGKEAFPLILEGLKQEETIRKSLGKFRPENMYDDAGNVVSTYWTQQTFKK